jgi:uncharacterized protein involved in exopolysaccharide biosynthesis
MSEALDDSLPTRGEYAAPAAEASEGIGVLDFAIVLAKHKLLVIGLPLVVAIAVAAYSLTLPAVYTANTKILPPQQSQSSIVAALGQFGLVSPGAGGKSVNDLYAAMLGSRTLADAMIERFELKKQYGTTSSEAARATLGGRTAVSAGKDGMITIAVDDEDPKRAAAIANAYVEQLYKLNSTLAVTEASQRRLFFERQLAQARDNLAQAEVAATRGLEKGGLVQVEGQGRAILETTARLRGTISAKEIQASAMRTFATEDNPALSMVQKELDAMKRELAKLEGTGGLADGTGAAKGKGMDNFRLLRNVKYYETLFELLAKQYEIAKIEEAKDASLIQVLDPALEPEGRSKPRRTFMVAIATAVALFIAFLLAFVIESLKNATTDASRAAQIDTLKRHLSLRPR